METRYPAKLDTLPTGGMGIPLMRQLMRQLMDGAKYSHHDGINEVVLVQRLYPKVTTGAPEPGSHAVAPR